MQIKKILYKSSLLTLLGVTRAVSSVEMNPPGKWVPFFDSLKASSDMAHCKISELDKEIGGEFAEKEELVEKRLGKKKFYSSEELEDVKDRKGEIRI